MTAEPGQPEANAPAPAKIGRPSSYSQETADAIINRMIQGETLRTICSDDGMPSTAAVCRWLADDRYAAFREQYERAREAQFAAMAEELLEIADDGANDTYVDDDGNTRTDHDVIARSRLRVDTRKWLLSKVLPKKYGDRVAVEATGADGGPIKTEDVSGPDLARRIAFLLAKGLQPDPKETKT